VILQLKKDIVTSFKFINRANKLSYDEKAKLFENFSILLKSGIPIIKSIDIIQQQNDKLKFLNEIKENLFTGKSLKDSISQTQCFDELSITLVDVGEKTGRLDEAFEKLSKYYRHLDETYKEIKSASYYPIFILSMLIFLFGFIILYFVPNVISLYGGEIPNVGGWSYLLIKTFIFIKNYLLELLFSIIIFIVFLFKIITLYKKPIFFSRLKYKFPILGNLIFKQKINNLIWALEIMLTSGIDILNALSVLENVSKDYLLLEKLQIIQNNILKGNSLYDSVIEAGINEHNLLYFVSIGEETGDLENRLRNLTYLYTQEIKRKTKELTSLAQPVFIAIVTLAIGITMLAIVMPLLDYNLLYSI